MKSGESGCKRSGVSCAHLHVRRSVEFPIGALVWRRNHTLSDASKARTAKLEPKFIGPFKIAKRTSSTVYELETLQGKTAGAVHVEDLRPVSS
ncbi:hypothetical protein J437_LFUL016777 [Ladona fulva]|uniref:Tf2-1-like SH3-like domain-containing protein n=1 Tax=Ladona fulva TaxID=123851 RepID=A0A8K0KL90_LADFU|nr:hypothetical protein J437_LFUL016777 [Ladona fulva]